MLASHVLLDLARRGRETPAQPVKLALGGPGIRPVVEVPLVELVPVVPELPSAPRLPNLIPPSGQGQLVVQREQPPRGDGPVDEERALDARRGRRRGRQGVLGVVGAGRAARGRRLVRRLRLDLYTAHD